MTAAADSSIPEPVFKRSAIAVSSYDRVAGMVVALLILLGISVGVLLFIWLAGKLTRSAPRSIPVVLDTSGGNPNANEVESASLEPPSIEEVRTMNVPLSTLRDSIEAVDKMLVAPQADWEPTLQNLNPSSTAQGQKQAFGEGGGSGGIARGSRWEIHYDAGIPLNEYRRQLEYFDIELAAVSADGRAEYLRFDGGNPIVDRRSGESEVRLFMSWRDGSPRRDIDRKLLEEAGVFAADKTLAQFLSAELEQTLARLEQEFAGRDPREIRRTRFAVRGIPGGGYEFFVAEQTGL